VIAALLSAAVLAPATFAPASGWHVGAGRVQACPGVSTPVCASAPSWAATVRWRDCGVCLPHRTVAHLSADGIALQIQIGFEQNPPNRMRPLRWPPRIRGVVSPFEGLPPRIGVFQAYGFVRGWSTSLFIYFGRPKPDARQIARARTELATVRFPRH
jgi:hypothetical protein